MLIGTLDCSLSYIKKHFHNKNITTKIALRINKDLITLVLYNRKQVISYLYNSTGSRERLLVSQYGMQWTVIWSYKSCDPFSQTNKLDPSSWNNYYFFYPNIQVTQTTLHASLVSTSRLWSTTHVVANQPNIGCYGWLLVEITSML